MYMQSWAVANNPLIENPVTELETMKDEEKASATFDLGTSFN